MRLFRNYSPGLHRSLFTKLHCRKTKLGSFDPIIHVRTTIRKFWKEKRFLKKKIGSEKGRNTMGEQRVSFSKYPPVNNEKIYVTIRGTRHNTVDRLQRGKLPLWRTFSRWPIDRTRPTNRFNFDTEIQMQASLPAVVRETRSS